jgi:flagellar biosynthesis protein FlhA
LPEVALPPDAFNRLARSVSEQIAEASQKGRLSGRRDDRDTARFVRMVLSARGIQNPVLSFEEIGLDAKPALLGLAAP